MAGQGAAQQHGVGGHTRFEAVVRCRRIQLGKGIRGDLYVYFDQDIYKPFEGSRGAVRQGKRSEESSCHFVEGLDCRARKRQMVKEPPIREVFSGIPAALSDLQVARLQAHMRRQDADTVEAQTSLLSTPAKGWYWWQDCGKHVVTQRQQMSLTISPLEAFTSLFSSATW